MAPGTTPRILFARDRATEPWRDGGGSTAQVAIRPDTATIDDFDWRISIAMVDHESQFSFFPGVDRWLMPLTPGGMSLRFEGETTWIAEREAFAFAGEVSVRAVNVTESGLDLNLMVRRVRTRGSLLTLHFHGDTAIAATAHEHVVVLVLEGTPSVENSTLGFLDALELEPGSEVVVTGDAVVAIARIRLKEPAVTVR